MLHNTDQLGHILRIGVDLLELLGIPRIEKRERPEPVVDDDRSASCIGLPGKIAGGLLEHLPISEARVLPSRLQGLHNGIVVRVVVGIEAQRAHGLQANGRDQQCRNDEAPEALRQAGGEPAAGIDQAGGANSDLPIPPNATDQASLGGIITFSSPDAPKTVGDYYRKQVVANGWKIASDTSMDALVMLTVTKDTRSFSIMITTGKDNKGSSVVITPSNK